MRIVGEIKNSDYINCFKLTVIPQSIKLKIYKRTAAVFIMVVSALIGFSVLGRQGIYIGLLIGGCATVLTVILNKKLMGLWISDLDEIGELNNTGIAKYEINESNLEFTGVMYSCVIPINVIRSIENSNGTTYLKFGNYSGFIVPKLLSEGNIDDFIKALSDKMNKYQNVKLQ